MYNSMAAFISGYNSYTRATFYLLLHLLDSDLSKLQNTFNEKNQNNDRA